METMTARIRVKVGSVKEYGLEAGLSEGLTLVYDKGQGSGSY